MRRSNFLVGALVALVTFVSLSAFVGRGRWGGYRGWRHHRCYYDDRYYDRDARDGRLRDQSSPADTTHIP